MIYALFALAIFTGAKTIYHFIKYLQAKKEYERD